jgi:hypothetical protein
MEEWKEGREEGRKEGEKEQGLSIASSWICTRAVQHYSVSSSPF